MLPSAISRTFQNGVLASLSAAEITRFAPYLAPVSLEEKQTLYNVGELIDTFFFLEDGVCSMVVPMASGRTVGVALIGQEGFIGASALLGPGRSPAHVFMQISGSGFYVRANAFRAQLDISKELRLLVQRSVEGLLTQMSQTAACNCLHGLTQRLARWLLMCQDRVHSDRVDITQEGLAIILGSRRPTITSAAAALQRDGLIGYFRGHLTIQDRQGLLSRACECYQVVHDEYLRLKLI
jgi:CRP-like cAMP-binding protein